ncbi:hypothetical protein SISNIDRAFT_483930 [Sistotremastrum niveocremeum HHB9708]|uniref:Uncharacterized protein n=1 Tax=Sistotremastrum niveocremeum HHB9708 TaxID=1314777 RepID=A0A164WGD1_9AGAM|nr:hypothetical protein SISNIDRAFT_483930 [Sistotremastrum niveocremeum HHB9708]
MSGNPTLIPPPVHNTSVANPWMYSVHSSALPHAPDFDLSSLSPPALVTIPPSADSHPVLPGPARHSYAFDQSPNQVWSAFAGEGTQAHPSSNVGQHPLLQTPLSHLGGYLAEPAASLIRGTLDPWIPTAEHGPHCPGLEGNAWMQFNRPSASNALPFMSRRHGSFPEIPLQHCISPHDTWSPQYVLNRPFNDVNWSPSYDITVPSYRRHHLPVSGHNRFNPYDRQLRPHYYQTSLNEIQAQIAMLSDTVQAVANCNMGGA